MTSTTRPKKAKKSAFKKDTSPHVHQNPKISFDLNIREFPWTERQKEIIDAVLVKKSRLTMVDGIWGSGKTLIALNTCLQLLKQKKISNILYIRNIVQSGTGTLGWLGGDLETRLSPYMLPFQQKLDELLPKEQVDRLIKDKIVESQPVALLRGTSYNCYGIIIDEASCMTKEDIMLALSRVGNFSYVFLVGDDGQRDVSNSGFREIFDLFSDEESKENKVYTFKLQDKMDVMRSELLRFIMKKVRGEE
jgi:phosphate starvation-inducible protein PhoH